MNRVEEYQYKTLDEDINRELKGDIIRPIYIIFNQAIKTYEELMHKESDIFQGEYFNDIKGRLLGYIIKRAFSSELLSENFPFKVICTGMNFNQKRPELRRGNILLTIAKTSEICKLPNRSKYKLKYSKGNSALAKQLFIKDIDTLKVDDIPYYGIICYNYSDNELKFLDILIPDNNYKTVIKRVNIPMIMSIDTKSNANDEKQQESILDESALKKEIEKDIINKKIN